MKVLFTGDWHLDRVTAGVLRYEEIADTVGRMLQAALEERVDLFVFDGDLGNPGTNRIHRAVTYAMRVAQRLLDSQIPSLWLPGNHDVVEDGFGTSVLSPLAELVGVTVMESPGYVEFKGVGFLVLPFTSRSHTYDPAAMVRATAEEGRRVAVVVGHLTIEGMARGSEVIDMPRGRDVLFPYAECKTLFPEALLVNGHYHCGGQWDGPLGPVHLPGALARLTMGERGFAPGYLVAEVG